MLRRLQFLFLIGLPVSGAAQDQDTGTPATPPIEAPQPVLPPATKLEAFKPSAGAVTTMGYTDLGTVSGVAVDVREMQDGAGNTVRGLVFDVHESQYRRERAFVDADEVSELLAGLDALLEVKSNPTSFKNFEVRYTTRGGLQLTAFNESRGTLRYAVQAGRTLRAQRFLSADGMRKLSAMIREALQPPGRSEDSRPQGQARQPGLGSEVPPGMAWVGDAKTRAYYSVACPAASGIAPADRLYYADEKGLRSSGFTKATDC